MKNSIKNLVSLFILSVFFLLAVGSGGDTKPATPDVKISSTQLYDAYKANEVAADNSYKGKVIAVTGTVDGVGKDIMDDTYITLVGDGVIGTVQCFISKDFISKAATVSKGTTITITGTCDGKLMNVLLKDCTL